MAKPLYTLAFQAVRQFLSASQPTNDGMHFADKSLTHSKLLKKKQTVSQFLEKLTK